jgi:hypothetical protein
MLKAIRTIISRYKEFTKAELERHQEPLLGKLDLQLTEPESYAVKRAAAKAFLGKKWILHPRNQVQRQQVEPRVLERSKDNA